MLKLQKLNSWNLEIAKPLVKLQCPDTELFVSMGCREIAHSSNVELFLPASEWPHMQIHPVSKSDNTP